jgi:hypothetical protein
MDTSERAKAIVVAKGLIADTLLFTPPLVIVANLGSWISRRLARDSNRWASELGRP